jgi:hypothetical protein
LIFGKFCGFSVVDSDLPGVAAGKVVTPSAAGLIVGLIEALGGAGSFPCWISEARCATDGGKEAASADGAVPPVPASPVAAFGPGCRGRLITLLMTVVLWMLAKITLFGGGAT